MAYKLIISKDNQILREHLLRAETRIGRRHHNDLVLEDATVSGKHAVLRMPAQKVEIEDLGSTNGTYINGDLLEPHTLRPLQLGDAIVIGPYRISLQAQVASSPQDTGAEPSLFANTIPCTLDCRNAFIEFTAGTGANVGRKLPLTKVVTTIGTPGMGVISLTRKLNLYVLKQLEGANPATINGNPVTETGVKLNHGDRVRLAEIEFLFHID
ncbi:MAG: FHA domain-containing protein [Comamonadaceae bacterium]|nr:FHA domain-containing protein [Comamonadaceae bacterium]